MYIVKINTNFLSVCIRVVIKNKKSEIILPVFGVKVKEIWKTLNFYVYTLKFC